MLKNLISYFNGEVEYSVNLHIINTQRKNNVMFITVTKVDNGMDYTVIFFKRILIQFYKHKK